MNEPKVNLLIREMMKKKGISAEQLGERLGIAYSTLTTKLRGNLSVNSLYDIAQVLDCEIADFFPVHDGYVHWTQGEDTAPKESDVMICPNCGTKFKIIR